MPSPDSRVIVACAGSGKTRLLVNEALARRDHRIAVVTYTKYTKTICGRSFSGLDAGILGFRIMLTS